MSTERSLDDLLALRTRVRARQHSTSLEQVRVEVGDRLYAEVEAACWDRPVVIRRGTVVGLPIGTYLIALRTVIRRIRNDQTVATLAASS